MSNLGNMILNKMYDRFNHDLSKRKKRKTYCSNCNKYGHAYKECTRPITSFGIIAFRQDDKNNLKFLNIQSKDSKEYVEFIRGRYLKTDYNEAISSELLYDSINQVRVILKYITLYERAQLEEIYESFPDRQAIAELSISAYTQWYKKSVEQLTEHFKDMWNTLWINHENKYYRKEYSDALRKFLAIIEGYLDPDTDLLVNLGTLLAETRSYRKEPSWGFPKGRRNAHEMDIDCAKREFCEETNYTEDEYTLINLPPITETFKGTNNIMYTHIYYLAEMKYPIRDPELDPSNPYQVGEIRAIEWISYGEVLSRIREDNPTRRSLLDKVHYFITEYYGKE